MEIQTHVAKRNVRLTIEKDTKIVTARGPISEAQMPGHIHAALGRAFVAEFGEIDWSSASFHIMYSDVNFVAEFRVYPRLPKYTIRTQP